MAWATSPTTRPSARPASSSTPRRQLACSVPPAATLPMREPLPARLHPKVCCCLASPSPPILLPTHPNHDGYWICQASTFLVWVLLWLLSAAIVRWQKDLPSATRRDSWLQSAMWQVCSSPSSISVSYECVDDCLFVRSSHHHRW